MGKAPTARTVPSLRAARYGCVLPLHEAPRAVTMLPAAVQAPVAGLNISALVTAGNGEFVTPPATSTRPSDKRTALLNSRVTDMLPVADHVFVDGLNMAAVLNTPPHRSPPPDTSTRPSGSRTAIWPVPTAAGRLRVDDQLPVAGSYA